MRRTPSVEPPQLDDATAAAQTEAETETVAAVLRAVDDAVAWLNAHNGCADPEVTLRVLKVTEEVGEAAQAWIGATGQNPRKGITHSRAEVADELADVVMAALVAIASLGAYPAAVLAAKAAAISTRTHSAATRAAATRTGGGEAG